MGQKKQKKKEKTYSVGEQHSSNCDLSIKITSTVMILVPTSENPQIRKKSVKKKQNKTKQKLIKIQKSDLILYLVWQRNRKAQSHKRHESCQLERLVILLLGFLSFISLYQPIDGEYEGLEMFLKKKYLKEQR